MWLSEGLRVSILLLTIGFDLTFGIVQYLMSFLGVFMGHCLLNWLLFYAGDKLAVMN